MTPAEKLVKIAENEQKVYEAGKASMIDESKIIEKTATGTGIVALDDVSEIPHNITVHNVGGKEVIVRGKNLFDGELINWNDDATRLMNKNAIRVSPNTNYYLSAFLDDGSSPTFGIYGNNDGSVGNTTDTMLKGNGNDFNSGEYKYVWFRTWKQISETGVSSESKIQVEFGTMASSYETPIKFKEYTANADGKIEGIESLSPNMTFICGDADISVAYHKSYGMQTEYDRFWDAFQDNGRRTNYNYGFAGDGWNDVAFKPKYDLIGVTYVNNLFQSNNTITTISCIIDLTKLAGTAQSVFQNAPKLRTIKEIIVNENTNINNNCFQNTSSLEKIRFSGVIAKDINLSACANLNAEDAANIITDNLKYFEGDEVFTRTIYLHANVWDAIRNWVQETGGSGYEVEQLCDDKGWNRV